jgi:hypothetical protein
LAEAYHTGDHGVIEANSSMTWILANAVIFLPRPCKLQRVAWIRGREPTGAIQVVRSTESEEQSQARVWLIVGTVLAALAFLPSLILPGLALFMFDAPGSETNPLNHLLALGLFSAPVLLIVAPLLAWTAFSAGNYRGTRAAIGLLGLPVLIGCMLLLG